MLQPRTQPDAGHCDDFGDFLGLAGTPGHRDAPRRAFPESAFEIAENRSLYGGGGDGVHAYVSVDQFGCHLLGPDHDSLL
jgi:hypothetical protein